jgi:hypothetical protein
VAGGEPRLGNGGTLHPRAAPHAACRKRPAGRSSPACSGPRRTCAAHCSQPAGTYSRASHEGWPLFQSGHRLRGWGWGQPRGWGHAASPNPYQGHPCTRTPPAGQITWAPGGAGTPIKRRPRVRQACKPRQASGPPAAPWQARYLEGSARPPCAKRPRGSSHGPCRSSGPRRPAAVGEQATRPGGCGTEG